MRLIDADALKQVLCDECDYHETLCREKAECDTVSAIDAQPTVEAVPVVHGHWTVHEEPLWHENTTAPFYRCECGYDTRYDTPYCPMCGAKMDDAERREDANL